MSKKILIVLSSFRKNGNSNLLAQEFFKGAIESGNQVEMVSIPDLKMEYCKGCLMCQKTGKCVINDDMKGVLDKMQNSDVLVFATPVYYYGMSGQMKTFLDRSNPLFPANYRFRDIYLLTAAADEDEFAVEGTKKGLHGWITCFEKTKIVGNIHASSVNEIGEIKKRNDLLKSAVEMGKSIQ